MPKQRRTQGGKKSSVSRGFLFIYFCLSEKPEDAGLFNADQSISWKRKYHQDELKRIVLSISET